MSRSTELRGAEQAPRVHTLPWQEQVAHVEEACRALGVPHGRARHLAKLLTELYRDNKRSRDHIHAANETCEVTDIYYLWEPRLQCFPGLRERLAKCLRKGPVVAEDERPSTASNKPRNDAFVYLLAGYLLEAGIDVLAVDEIPREDASWAGRSDIVLNWEGQRIVIECKRPQARSGVQPCMSKALKQIQEAKSPGIVALDCSRVICPEGKVLATCSPHSGLQYVEDRLEDLLRTILQPRPDEGRPGLALFARVAAMTEVRSTILLPTGEPDVRTRPDSICPWVVWHDPQAPATRVVRDIWREVERMQVGRSGNPAT